LGVYGGNNSGKTSLLNCISNDSSLLGELVGRITGGLRFYGKKFKMGLGFDPHNTAYLNGDNDLLWDELDIKSHFKFVSILRGTNLVKKTKQAQLVNKFGGDLEKGILTYEDWIKSFGLVSRNKVSDLSEGNRLFTTLALVFSSESHTHILDNPTQSLDYFKKSFLYKINEAYRKNIPYFSSMVCSNDGEDISRMCDSFSILFNGSIKISHRLDRIVDRTNHECKIIVNKDPESYDITVRLENTLKNFEYEI
jgi:ABC-type multidrug transport system ATPase subunit